MDKIIQRNNISTAKFFVFFIASFIILIASISITLFLKHTYKNNLQYSERMSQQTAKALENFAQRTFVSANFTAQRIVTRVAERGLQAIRDNRSELSEIKALANVIHEGRGIYIYDKMGKLLVSSETSPLFPSIDEFDFYKAHALSNSEIHIASYRSPRSEPSFASDDIFIITRKLVSMNGRFQGVVIVALSSQHQPDFYPALDLGENGSVAMLRTDGELLWRVPWPDYEEADIKERFLLNTVQSLEESGTVTDRDRYIISYQKLEDLPIIVTAVFDTKELKQRWNKIAIILIILLFLGLFIIMTLVFFILKSIKSEEKIRIYLSESNQNLEELITLRTEEALQQKRQAQLANEAKSRFLEATSHDLRQPLQAARLFLDILSAQLGSQGLHDIAKKAVDAIDAGGEVLNALLDISDLESGTIRPEKQDFSIDTVLYPLVIHHHTEAARKNLAIRYVSSQTAVHTDPLLLKRMLDKLLSNAVRFTETGKIIVGCRRRGKAIRVEIWDSGAGISTDQKDHIFKDFYQINNPERDRTQGLGLGLSVVSRLSLLLDLKTGMESWPGKGSVFWVDVPMAESR